MREGGKGSGLCSQLLTPKRSNLPLYCSFPSTFRRSFIQDCQRAGQGILLAELLDLNEPWDRGGSTNFFQTFIGGQYLILII